MHVLEERCCSRTRLNCLLDERTQGKCEYFHDRLSGSYLHAKPLADWCVSWKNKTCARIKFLIIILNDHFSIVSNSFFSISYALIYFWGAFAVLYVPSRACVSEALGRIDWKMKNAVVDCVWKRERRACDRWCFSRCFCGAGFTIHLTCRRWRTTILNSARVAATLCSWSYRNVCSEALFEDVNNCNDKNESVINGIKRMMAKKMKKVEASSGLQA